MLDIRVYISSDKKLITSGDDSCILFIMQKIQLRMTMIIYALICFSTVTPNFGHVYIKSQFYLNVVNKFH